MVSVPPSPPLRFRIHGADGVQQRTETVDREIIKIGRLASCQLRIDDELAARMHAVIEVERGVPTIIDLGSRSGTFVNGEQVSRRELRPGDRIQIGRTVAVLEHEPASSPAAPIPLPARPSRLACPRCRTALIASRRREAGIEVCATCGGLWLPLTTLRRIAELPALAAEVRALADDAARRAPLGGNLGVFNLGCPVCGVLMQRRQHRRSGIVVDLCGGDGTWFDRGEVACVLDRAPAGGPYRVAPGEPDVSVALPAQSEPIWVEEPAHAPPLVVQLVELLFDL